MKFVRKRGQSFLFHVGKREKRLLFQVLRLYPLIPNAHHRLSRFTGQEEIGEDQKLLEEALATQKRESRKQLEAMLTEPGRFTVAADGFRFTLNRTQMEWFLQVLNDVRVGAWLVLGKPDEKTGRKLELNEKSTRYLLAMEYCALIQSVLLRALDGMDARAGDATG